MDEGQPFEEHEVATVGQRLRSAREAAGMTLEEVATTTRIPTRHLESLENSDFERLPAPTYTIGFAKNYAAAVGLDHREIAGQLREEIGGTRPASHQIDAFEPADPARAMPKWLIVGTLVAVIVVAIGFSWLRSREYSESGPVAAEPAAANPPAIQTAPTTPPPAAATAQGPVVLTANEEVWLQVKDGSTTLKEGILAAGQSFEVPGTAAAPTLTTGKPEALRISVGSTAAPSVGPAATTVRNVSLLAKDLVAAPPSSNGAPPPAAPNN